MQREDIRKAAAIVLAATWLILISASRAESQNQPTSEGVRRDEMADLAVVSLKATPEYPVVGERVKIEVAVRNIGRSGAGSVNIVLFAGMAKVASKRADIGAGQVVNVTMLWTAQQTGVHSLATVVDPDHDLTEIDRLDNSWFLDIGVSPKHLRGVDFAISRLEIVSPPNRPIVLRSVVKNVGKIASEAPLVFRLDNEIVAMRYVQMLKPGQSVNIDIPYSKQALTLLISVEVNPRNRHTEASPLNNILTRDTRPSTDLVVERLSVGSEQFEQGRPRQITVSFSVRNAGSKPVAAIFRTDIFPSITSSEGSVARLGTFSVTTPGLGIGQSVYISRTITSPAGRFNVRVQVDVDGKVFEVNKQNNLAVLNVENAVSEVDRWVSIGPRLITWGAALGAVGRLHLIAINQQAPSTIYVGSPRAGIWKTTDTGASWRTITDILPSLLVSALAISPSDSSQIFVATTDRGVFSSIDGGSIWNPIMTDTTLTPDTNETGEVMLVHPTTPGLVYVTGRSGIFALQTDSAGTRWTLKLSGGRATDLVMDPSNPDRLLAALSSPIPNPIPGQPPVTFTTGIYESRDAGNNWRPLSGCSGGSLPPTIGTNYKITLALSGNTVYAGYKAKQKFELYRTTGIGCTIGGFSEQTWERRGEIIGPGADDNAWNRMNADPSDPRFVYVSGVNFLISTDGGVTFSQRPGQQPHVDHHGFATDPTSARVIYVITDGGIYRSPDRGLPTTLPNSPPTTSWSFIGDGLANVEFYDIKAAATSPNLIIGGTQDNGTLQYDGSSNAWQVIKGGDGATVDIDPTDSDIKYAMNQYQDSIARKIGLAPPPPEHGRWQCIACGITPTPDRCFNMYFQVHPARHTTLLASCVSLWRSTFPTCAICPSATDAGSSGGWERIFPTSAAISTGSVIRTAIDPTLDLYYLGTSTGELWAGGSGTNWQKLNLSPSQTRFSVTDIDVDPSNAANVFVATNQQLSERVFFLKHTTDGPSRGTIVPQDITSDLPIRLRVNALAIDRFLPFTIYAGTYQGVYRGRSADAGATWSWDLYSTGLPLTKINDLDVHPVTGVLRAATYGRSAYEVNTAPRGP